MRVVFGCLRSVSGSWLTAGVVASSALVSFVVFGGFGAFAKFKNFFPIGLEVGCLRENSYVGSVPDLMIRLESSVWSIPEFWLWVDEVIIPCKS